MTDKIIFWLDEITIFSIAKFLKELLECNLFAVIDVPDRQKNFFQEQQLVKFDKTWFYHDHVLPKSFIDLKYLSDFEKKYKINLWLLAINERLFYRFNYFYKFSREQILSILEQECKLFENVLDEIKPDFLIIKTTDLHHNHLFYEICKSRGIKIMILEQSRFGYRCMITEERDKIDYMPNLKDIEPRNRTIEELQNFLKTSSLSTQLDVYKNQYLTSKRQKIIASLEFLLISKNTNIKTHYTYFGRSKAQIIKKALWWLMIEKYREYFINRKLKKQVDENAKFIYFPLHQEPERVLLIASPFHTNQIETIRNIAKSVPAEYKLYVKEHPTQSIRGWRSIQFYKDIMEIPNVELLHPSISSEQIIKKCSLVISVGGTSGLEAAIYQKPSIIFANMGYGILSSIYKINALTELPEAIRLSLQKEVDIKELDKYLDIIEKNSFEFDYFGFLSDYTNYFFYGGHLADVDIPIEKMKLFLNNHQQILKKVAMEYVKKIKQHKTKIG